MARTRLLLLVACSLLTAPGRGQEPVGGEVGRQLEALRKKNEELEERLEAIESAPSSDQAGNGLQAHYGDITASFKVFGDVGLEYRNPEEAGNAHTNFFLGSVDFFANVQMGDHFRILSETVLEARGTETVFADQERLWAMWTFSDSLYFKLGTEHSPISRWNQLYHHGRWLETSISRPLLAAFEGDGGILPMHETGLEMGGRLQSGAGGFEWFTAVSNGRGLEPNNKQRTADRNDSKKIDAGLAFLPNAVPDLRFGTAFTYDEIPPDPTSVVAGRGLSIREFLATAHAQYRSGPFEMLGEFAWIEHDARELSSTFHHNAGYMQVALRAGELTPYARMDYRDMERNDPFYLGRNRDLDIVRPVAGVRYDPSATLAAKLEVTYGQEEQRGAGGVVDRDVLTLALQVSWVL
ncbi:MAG TPA: hypothetical protein VFZ65_12695 [Planctomycetota bacterium]|nr:hypothetical protein [Planctomycetota bacterium]